jgi:von Willebrand factor type A domain-containing protein
MRAHGGRLWITLLATLAAGLGALAIVGAPAQAASCSGSTTANIRGKSVALDQCARTTVARGGTTYRVTVFYTEQNTTGNLGQCTAAETAANRCEHALANADDPNGDNTNAARVATEMANALGFYIDRGLGFPAGGATDLTVLVGEDPRGGGINAPTQIYVDDEQVDQNDPLAKRLLAYHEMMHLIQDVWDTGVGWQGWYGEGIARAVEDRVDPALDADTGHLFIPELNGLMASDANRTADTTSTSYPSFLWWTWLFDQYRATGDTDPVIGWTAIRDFYTRLGASTDQLQAVRDFIAGRGGTLNKDWLDYSLSLWAYKLSPADARLTYLDSQIRSAGASLSGHTTITGGPAFNASRATPTVNSHSVRFFEMNPASQCDYASFRFDGQGRTYGFSVLTANGTALKNRWSATGSQWTRTVRTAGLSRLTGAVTGLDDTGPVKVGWGCVNPSVAVARPTTSAFELVGLPSAPRRFVVQAKVTGPGGEAIAGLTPDAFSVRVTKSSGGTAMNATVLQGAFVGDTYWLLVQAPGGANAGAGQFHDLRVSVGSASATQTRALLYADRAEDAIVVLDRSGSMADADKIGAARNGATLLADELSDSDQGGYVDFSTDAALRQGLARMGSGGHRGALEGSIAGATPGGQTSIGDGLDTAATEHDARRDPAHACGFVLLSDGYENEPQLWASVRDRVVDNGCALHAVALGPEANEPLMQGIAASTPGGSYDYADVGGIVPVGSSGSGPGAAGGAGGAPGATQTLDWANNLSRLYDVKAAKLADRQRIATFVGVGEEGCRTVDATVGFESRLPGARVPAGDAFADAGIPVRIDGQGAVAFGADHRSGGAGMEAQLEGPLLRLGFDRGCEVQFRYAQRRGEVVLINGGEQVTTESVAALDGRTVGGARIRVLRDADKGDTGTVLLSGDVAGVAIGGSGLTIDEVVHRTEGKGRTFFVDPTTTQLVTTVAWQQPAPGHRVTLIAPDGSTVPAAMGRSGAGGTNEVWTVPNPQPGEWRVLVEGVDQPFFVTETAQTDVALRLVAGAPEGSPTGTEVPLAAFFSGPNGAVKGATVWATVTDPARRSALVALVDDGAHHDGEAGDGVYGGAYRATSLGDAPARDRTEEGHGPVAAGSYTVAAVGIAGRNRREDTASFAVTGGGDADQDGLPDAWEKRHGTDAGDPADARADADGDGLPAICEYRLGGDPAVADTDGGGEADGSEASYDGTTCRAETDPAAAGDDRVGALSGLTAEPEAVNGVARIALRWGGALRGDLVAVDVQRRQGTGPWSTLAAGVTARGYTDGAVSAGQRYQYRLLPAVADRTGTRAARELLSAPVRAAADPDAPYGSVLIAGGAARTATRDVSLQLIAEDREGGEGDAATGGRIGTPVDRLEVRVSNRADFRGAAWQPFRPRLAWTLAATPAGRTATVYAAFRDEAGNVSTRDGVTTDSIQVQP